MNTEADLDDDEVEVPDGPAAVRVIPWLRCNLGRAAVAALTDTDADALMAAAQVAELYQRVRIDEAGLKFMASFESADACERRRKHSERVAEAFHACVLEMQPKCRHMAYHAIAMVGNWSERELWWFEAGFIKLPDGLGRCKYEPGGSKR